jgi:hypothetical protein
MGMRQLARRHDEASLREERQQVDGAALGQDDELLSHEESRGGLERPHERFGGRERSQVEDFRHGSSAVLWRRNVMRKPSEPSASVTFENPMFANTP